MRNYNSPVYRLDRKEYKSINGLVSALIKKHKASEVSGVSSDRKIRVFAGRGIVCAEYAVSKPELGKPMDLTLE